MVGSEDQGSTGSQAEPDDPYVTPTTNLVEHGSKDPKNTRGPSPKKK